MEIHTNIPLKNFTTLKLGGNAKFMAEAHNPNEVAEIYKTAKSQNLPVFVLGGGSNIIARDEGFDGYVILVRIPGFDVIADDLNTTTLRFGAGENWDAMVKKSVDLHLSGIESLSAIPGTVGAAPVQNLGAYGQEIADTLQTIEAYDTTTDTFVILQNDGCNFSYRDSIFRGSEKGRYIITAITVKLSKNPPQPPFYDSLQTYLDQHDINIYTVETIRNAVIEVRKSKLPDPTVTPNVGSFFKNPIVEKWQLDDLKSKFPSVKAFEMGDGKFKIPAGWLIENAGLKGCLIDGIRVYDQNALVLVNESAGSYHDLASARDTIIDKVRDKFQLVLEQEPLELAI